MRLESGHVRRRVCVPQSGTARGAEMTRWLRGALLLALAAAARAHLLAPAPAARRIKLHGWHLELHENQAIKAPLYHACQFYQGRVLHEKSSTVTLTECEGKLYGLIQVNGHDYVLEPGLEHTEDSHVLHKRDVMMTDHAPVYNLTGDTVDDLELDFEEDEPPKSHVRPRHSHTTEKDYFRDLPPVTRPLSGVQDLWLEMAIVADHTMVKFHGRNKVKHYILALMNIVSAIFNHPSLGSNMTLVINKLYLYEEQDSIIKSGDVKKSLEGVNRWNYRHLAKLPSGSTGWDATVWLTREQLGGPSGFAPVGGVCSRKRSAAIDRDEGLTSAFVVAHELAHLLGLTHDGGGQCDAAARQGSVMAATVLATLHDYVWSNCSKHQFHDKSKNWRCLHERSTDDGVELGGAKELVNFVYTMDEQCRMEFGEGYGVCKTVKTRTPCARLMCAHRDQPHVCRSKRAQPLRGTPCRKNHWCIGRVCEPMPGYAADGEEIDPTPRWDEWGAWSQCGADCGYGLRTRGRHCRVKGVIKDEACEGASTQATTCWAGPCAAQRDSRGDACRREAVDFIPYMHRDESKSCEIWCVNYTGGEPTTHGLLPDGTPCSYDRPYDLCFQGACVRGQCNASDAACNWCPDGYCSNNTHLYSRQLGSGWTRLAVIPHAAYQLNIHISSFVPLNIAIRERRRDKPLLRLSKQHSVPYKVPENNYLKYDTLAPQNLQIIEVDSNVIDVKDDRYGLQGRVVAAGAVLEWTQTDTFVIITAKSQLHTDLMILGAAESPSAEDDSITVQVSVNYSTSLSRVRPKEYRWGTERGPCSASCGGGVRVVRTHCARGQLCTPTRYERCNTHKCEFVWAAGAWEECSATCGDDGVQERQLFCVPVNASISSRRDLIVQSSSPALCRPPPTRVQACNRFSCPAYWQELPWTPCSSSCGRGTSRRPLACPAAQEELCGPKPRERRRRCRLRRCAPSLSTTPTCSLPDHTRYCELFPLEQIIRNCGIPPFRKYCCKTCENAFRRVG